VTGIQTENHWPGSGWLKDLAMNFLPELEALRIDFVTAVSEVDFEIRR